MTVAVCVQVHDGIILASDSALSLSLTDARGHSDIVNVYNNANKIFNLRKGLPIGAMFFGMGSIGPSSISTLAKDLRRRFTGDDPAFQNWKIDSQDYTIEAVAIRAREFLFEERFKALGDSAPKSKLGFFVGGYSAGAELSELWCIEIQDGQCPPPTLILGQGVASVYVGGEPDVFNRIVNGYGLGLPTVLVEKLGMDERLLDQAMQIIRAELGPPLVEAPMPVQDAIDFAEFIVYATATISRFKKWASTVGGPIESAAITKHEGFKWVRRKHYFDETYNPREAK